MKRIQRKRTKGWSMPPNAVYVGRPTRWGNPYSGNREQAISDYRVWLKRKLEEDPDFLDPLCGKDLACWCPLDKPCHVDVLLDSLGESCPRCGNALEKGNGDNFCPNCYWSEKWIEG